MPLTTSDYLLLRPEDVKGRIGECTYVRVLWSGRNVTTTRPVADDEVEDDLVLTVFTELAEQRKVTGEDMELGLGTMMRKAVAAMNGGHMIVGQVIAVEGDLLHIKGSQGVATVNVGDVTGIVPDLVAILLARQPEVVKKWNTENLKAAISGIEEELGKVSERDEELPPPVEDLLAHVPGGEALSKRTVVQWVSKMTGKADYTTIDHAIRFAYFERTGQPKDIAKRAEIGHTIGEDPGTWDGEDLPRLGKRSVAEFSSERRAYDDAIKRAWREEEEEEKTAQPSFYGPLTNGRPTAATQRGAAGTIGTDDDVVRDLEIERQRLAAMNGDPVLLRAYFAANTGLPASVGTTKPNRTDFRPHNSRIKAHQLVTDASLQGTSPMEFCMMVSADEELRFRRVPAVVMRVYDLDFGAGGLSIMHFKSFTHKDEMAARDRNETMNMIDYSATVSLPAPAVASDWEAVTSAVANFVEYARKMCDPVTVEVAEAIERFVREQRLYELWQPNELPTVVFWIDNTLGRFHQAVVRDALGGTGDRLGAAGWFVETNAVLQRYRSSVLDTRYRGGSTGGDRLVGRSEDTGPRPPKMSPEIIDAIPKRGKKQLCVRHMSNSSCKGKGDGVNCSRFNCVHQRPATINRLVGDYINEYLGGLYPGIKLE